MNRNTYLYKVLKRIEEPNGNSFFEFINVLMNMSLMLYGGLVFKKIKKKYPDRKIILLPSRSAGDLRFLKDPFEKMLSVANIHKYIFIVDKEICYKPAKELNFKHLLPLSMLSLKGLMVYSRVSNIGNDNIINCFSWCFFDMDVYNKYFKIQNRKESITNNTSEKYKKYGILPHKTVILSPYESSITATNLEKLPRSFWEGIAKELKRLGFKVYTNCNTKNNEKVIKCTKVIFPKISEINDVVTLAGNVVAVRSGFVDYLSMSDAFKIILYPNKKYKEIWCFSRTQGMSDPNCIELIYNEYSNDYNLLIKQVCDLINKRVKDIT